METLEIKDVKGKSVEIPFTEELVKSVLKLARKTGRADKRFDINIVEGQLAETELLTLLGDKTVEVKRDNAVSKTGNLAIEFMCRSKPSGIVSTIANWWAFALSGDKFNDEVIILVKTSRLKRMLGGIRTVFGGDGNKSEMFLLPLKNVVQPLEGVSDETEAG
jgi:hypothetical protein